jgi:hypothetical protein
VTRLETDIARAEQQQAQQQPEQIQPQPEAELPGIDPELQQALQNPKIRAALEQEAHRVNAVAQEAAQTRETFANATYQATALAVHSMMA